MPALVHPEASPAGAPEVGNAAGMAPLRFATAGGPAVVRATTRADGDLNADRVAPSVLAARWTAVTGWPTTWLDEVHGTAVVEVRAPGAQAGRVGDALVTADPGAALGVWVGDCAPVALVSPEGVVGAAHAGWRGLLEGVLEATVSAMHSLGARRVDAVVGPCIGAPCYEFGPADLDRIAARFGPSVRSRTAWGTPALDLAAGVHVALARAGVGAVTALGGCTACDPSGRWWSHRARADTGRHGLAVWLEPPAAGGGE